MLASQESKEQMIIQSSFAEIIGKGRRRELSITPVTLRKTLT